MKRINFILIILVISLFSQSCRKDVDVIDITPPNIPTVIKVISSVHGNVVDSDGNVVADASVTFQDEMVSTDINGVFQFAGETMNKNGTYISVEKDGYFKGSRRFYPSAGNINIVQIELLPLNFVGAFDSGTETTINHNGITLDFPKDAIVNENGSSFSGNVNIAVAYLDPTKPRTLDQMPGDLTGISTDEELVTLKSLGMFAVELIDDNGNQLQVKEGNLVNVKVSIPTKLQANAPSSIPMWHFDEEVGIWKEEGFAELVGDYYETSLGHFSFWNFDIPSGLVFMKGTILNRGVPIQGVTVMILDSDSNTSGYGVTDENGMFCGYIPENADLTIEVYNQCGEAIYISTITTIDVDILIDPINLNLLVDYASISGTTTYCDDELSEYAYIMVQVGTALNSFPIMEDGTFLGNTFYCTSGVPITITAFDPINNLSSGEYVFTIEGDLEVGNIELCSESLVEHIIVEYGDVKWNIPFDDDVINIFQHIESAVFLDVPGYLLNSIVTDESGLDVVFKFQIGYEEGAPYQIGEAGASSGGFIGHGLCSSQLVILNGVEYYKASGDLEYNRLKPGTEDNYDPSYESIYFDILIRNN